MRLGIVLGFLYRPVLAILRHVVEVPLYKETAHERMSVRNTKGTAPRTPERWCN
jgi:hypothetical protein